MATVRLYFSDERIGEKFSRGTQRQHDRVLTAIRGTAAEDAAQIIKQGRADIKQASPAFGRSQRWAPGLDAKVTEGGGSIRVSVTHKVPYAIVFMRQGGTDIKGDPLLWIPLSFAKDAQGVRARDYGPLFRVDRPGKAPLLLGGDPVEPKYFGKEQVHIPQKFKTFDIIRDVAKQNRQIYARQFRKAAG